MPPPSPPVTPPVIVRPEIWTLAERARIAVVDGEDAAAAAGVDRQRVCAGVVDDQVFVDRQLAVGEH